MSNELIPTISFIYNNQVVDISKTLYVEGTCTQIQAFVTLTQDGTSFNTDILCSGSPLNLMQAKYPAENSSPTLSCTWLKGTEVVGNNNALNICESGIYTFETQYLLFLDESAQTVTLSGSLAILFIPQTLTISEFWPVDAQLIRTRLVTIGSQIEFLRGFNYTLQMDGFDSGMLTIKSYGNVLTSNFDQLERQEIYLGDYHLITLIFVNYIDLEGFNGTDSLIGIYLKPNRTFAVNKVLFYQHIVQYGTIDLKYTTGGFLNTLFQNKIIAYWHDTNNGYYQLKNQNNLYYGQSLIPVEIYEGTNTQENSIATLYLLIKSSFPFLMVPYDNLNQKTTQGFILGYLENMFIAFINETKDFYSNVISTSTFSIDLDSCNIQKMLIETLNKGP